MPTDSYLIPALFMMTFVAAIVVALYQYKKAKKARAQHHQSAQAKAMGERPGERNISPVGSNNTMTPEQKPQQSNML